MKVKRVIVLILAGSVVASVVPFRREIWVWAAYEELGGDRELVFHRKRVPWLGGADFLVPDQACIPCRDHDHWQCLKTARGMNRKAGIWRAVEFSTDHDIPIESVSSLTCTCSNFYHGD